MSSVISISEKIKAIQKIVRIENVKFQTTHLINDINLLAETYNDTKLFAEAIEQTHKQLSLIVDNRINVSDLKYNYNGYQSCHYQSVKGNKQKADMRIVFARVDEKIFVVGFGNRWLPEEIYLRLVERIDE